MSKKLIGVSPKIKPQRQKNGAGNQRADCQTRHVRPRPRAVEQNRACRESDENDWDEARAGVSVNGEGGEYAGEGKEPIFNKEPLVYEFVKLATRSYK